jgi:cell cycle arrest protein BUB3
MFSFSRECQLPASPGLSCCRFNPWNEDIVAVSTWDGTIECYNSRLGRPVQSPTTVSAPQLSVEWLDRSRYASGGADGVLYINGIRAGTHDGVISSLSYVADAHLLVSGSWDGSVHFWDPRTQKLVHSTQTRTKVLSIANNQESKVVCGGTDRTLVTFDTRNLREPELSQTSFSYRTRCLAANRKYLAVGACEGRVAISYFDNSEPPWGFKAHVGNDERRFAYPVNGMAFRIDSPCFATGGSDGAVMIWDLEKRRKLQCLGDVNGDPFPTSVASLSFSESGKMLAVAVSYCYEFGEREHPPDQLIIYELRESD